MSEKVPGANIIIVLRNPIDRAYSHYQMDYAIGRVRCSFEEAVHKEIVDGEVIGSGPGYIKTSKYYPQLYRFYKAFPSSRIKVLLFEDLKYRKFQCLKSLSEFLDIENFDNYKR